MKENAKILYLFGTTAIALYLCGAFIALNLDPREWHEIGRMTYVFTVFMASIMISINKP